MDVVFLNTAPVVTQPLKSPVIPRIRSTAEFARYVGLARTTVSRVLNGQPGLKKKTIDRVQKAIEETGFVPNAYALHLKGKQSETIGVCLQNLSQPTLVQKLAVLQNRLRERGFTSFIEVFDSKNEWDVIRHFLSLRVQAVVFIGYFAESALEAHIKSLAANGTPGILIDQYGVKDVPSVSLDRAAGMEAVISHLVSLGHRTFGLLAYSDSVRSTTDRVEGIRRGLEAAGLHFAQATKILDHLHVRHQDFEYGRSLAKSFSALPDRPTALVALNDEIAVGALHGLKESGVRVPEDVSVVGFNNQDICLMTAPRVTSVDQRIDATVDCAVEALLDQLSKPAKGRPKMHRIAPQLVVRESTGPVALVHK